MSERTKRKSPKVPVFLEKLSKILETSPEHLIKWNDDGDKIIISDKKKFSKEVLPKFFRTSNFSSFVRQLNFYRFTKCVEKDKDDSKKSGKWVFMHENFLRDRPDMKNTIKRRTYQDQEAAREIASLRDTVDALVQRVQTLESMVGVKERNESLPPPPLSPVTKKRKRSCEDFESEQPQNETKTLPALPSDVMDMDMDWNATEIMTTTPIKRETTEELSEFLEGMDFQDTRKRTLPRPSLIRNPSWESVCENMSLPGDISAHDAAKVGEVLSYLMPQIQAALLNQMQKSSSGSLLSI